MQEFQYIPGLARRLFGGSEASDLRRAHARCGGGAAAAPEAVKCPRCESTNTKFCYYNNYNLSQPRHFCKSCRRYWTKGGVLRNVPVGGGCRKAKRSSSSSSSSAPSTPPSDEAKNPRRASASSPRSNGDSTSSPTAAASSTTMATTPATLSSSKNIAITGHNTNPFSSSSDDVAPPAPVFADQAAALASLFAPPSPPPPLPVFSFTAAQPKDEGVASVLPHETASADMAPFTSLDAGIFDQLGDASSSSSYWNAGSCWTDVQDPSVYLP